MSSCRTPSVLFFCAQAGCGLSGTRLPRAGRTCAPLQPRTWLPRESSNSESSLLFTQVYATPTSSLHGEPSACFAADEIWVAFLVEQFVSLCHREEPMSAARGDERRTDWHPLSSGLCRSCRMKDGNWLVS